MAAPFYPFDDAGGWDQLGWFVYTALAAVATALVAGAIGVVVGLRRGGHRRTAATALTFVPVALLLAAVTAGVGALAAPAVACWLVAGFASRPGTAGESADLQQPVPTTRPLRPVRAGLAQRLLVVLVVCGLVTALVLNELGFRLGGRDRSELLVWAACLPVLVVVPVALLRRRVPAAAVAALVAAMATLAALAVPAAVANAHPSPARLFRSVSQLPVPEGYAVAAHQQAVTSGLADAGLDSPGPDRLVLVNVVTIAPVPAAAPAIPAALRPDDEGRLPWPAGGDLQVLGVDLRSTPAVASSAVRRVVDARPRLERGPWVRASAVPVGDGALLVVSVRP